MFAGHYIDRSGDYDLYNKTNTSNNNITSNTKTNFSIGSIWENVVDGEDSSNPELARANNNTDDDDGSAIVEGSMFGSGLFEKVYVPNFALDSDEDDENETDEAAMEESNPAASENNNYSRGDENNNAGDDIINNKDCGGEERNGQTTVQEKNGGAIATTAAALETLFPPVTNDNDREHFVDAFYVDYREYLDLYGSLKPKVMEIDQLLSQLRTLPRTELEKDDQRRRLLTTLREKFTDLGFDVSNRNEMENDDENKQRRERLMQLAKKLRFIKQRINDYDKEKLQVQRPPPPAFSPTTFLNA